VQPRGALLNVTNANPKFIQFLNGHTDSVNSVAFSSDGMTLASGSCGKLDNNGYCVEGEIILWDTEKRQSLGQLIGHEGYVLSVAFSPDGKTLASGSADGAIILWDVEKQHMIGQPLTRHYDQVRSVAFSPDGRTLASGSDDSTVILWDVEKQQMIGQPLTGHNDWVRSVAFSPNGKTFASGSDDSTIILWDVDPEYWIRIACQRAGRNFTRAEWKQYGFSEPYRATCPQWPLEP